MQICKNVILPLAIFSTASRLWAPPTRLERRGIESNYAASSSRDFKLRYEECLQNWGNAT